jgi:hypothetical protein
MERKITSFSLFFFFTKEFNCVVRKKLRKEVNQKLRKDFYTKKPEKKIELKKNNQKTVQNCAHGYLILLLHYGIGSRVCSAPQTVSGTCGKLDNRFF